MGEMGRSVSQPLLGPHAPNSFWKFLRHIETFLDYLGDADTPEGRVLVPRNWAKLSKYIGSWEVNISASIRAPSTKFFLEVPETHRNISRLHGRC